MSFEVESVAVNAPNEKNSIFFLCDIQEVFRSRIVRMSTVIAGAVFLSRAAKLLEIPLVITEQQPFKKTVSEIDLKSAVVFVEKTRFSMVVDEVKKELKARPEVKNVFLFGIEAHVCVLQTTNDLLRAGYKVYLPVDAVSSQQQIDRDTAIDRMARAGAVLTTCESAIFELLGDAKHAKFKEILPLVKDFAQARSVAATAPAATGGSKL